MNEEKCPICHNHCDKNNLGCGRGENYFNNNSSEDYIPKDINEQVIMDLRKCGHMLHHNKELNPDELLSGLSEYEIEKLHELLSKISR